MIEKWMNITFMEKVRCMMPNSYLPKLFYAEVAKITCFLVNWSLSTTINKKTTEEV